MHDLVGGLLTRDPFTDPTSAGDLLTTVRAAAPSLAPEYYRDGNERAQPWTDSRLDTYYRHPTALTWLRGPHDAEITVSPRLGTHQVWANLSVAARSDAVDPLDVARLTKAAAARFGGDYGYCHRISPDDLTERFAPDNLVGSRDEPWVVMNFRTPAAGIPDLWWATILGPAFADLIGEQTIRTCPAALVEEVAPRTFWLQLTGSLDDCVDDRPAVLAARAKARAHLGADWFGTEDRPAARRITVPTPAAH